MGDAQLRKPEFQRRIGGPIGEAAQTAAVVVGIGEPGQHQHTGATNVRRRWASRRRAGRDRRDRTIGYFNTGVALRGFAAGRGEQAVSGDAGDRANAR